MATKFAFKRERSLFISVRFWARCNETLDAELYTEVGGESSLRQAVS